MAVKATPLPLQSDTKPPETLGPALVRVAAAQSTSPPSALRFLLGLMVGISLLVAVLALVPRRALPPPIVGVVDGQRELLVFVAVALVAAAGLVLFVLTLAVL